MKHFITVVSAAMLTLSCGASATRSSLPAATSADTAATWTGTRSCTNPSGESATLSYVLRANAVPESQLNSGVRATLSLEVVSGDSEGASRDYPVLFSNIGRGVTIRPTRGRSAAITQITGDFEDDGDIRAKSSGGLGIGNCSGFRLQARRSPPMETFVLAATGAPLQVSREERMAARAAGASDAETLCRGARQTPYRMTAREPVNTAPAYVGSFAYRDLCKSGSAADQIFYSSTPPDAPGAFIAGPRGQQVDRREIAPVSWTRLCSVGDYRGGVLCEPYGYRYKQAYRNCFANQRANPDNPFVAVATLVCGGAVAASSDLNQIFEPGPFQDPV